MTEIGDPYIFVKNSTRAGFRLHAGGRNVAGGGHTRDRPAYRRRGRRPASHHIKTRNRTVIRPKGFIMETEEIQQALSTSEFFKGFDREQIDDIAAICTIRTFEFGEFLFRQGDFGEHLYVIIEGQIHLERSMDFGQRKGTVVIETLGRGRILGCWSTLLNAPHVLMSSANCQCPTRVLAVKGSELHRMMTRNTALGFNILERLCFLLRDRIQAAYGAMEKI